MAINPPVPDYDLEDTVELTTAEQVRAISDPLRTTILGLLHERAATVTELADKGAKVVLLAHFGRPKGERVAEMSLAPIATAASATFGRAVSFASDCIGEPAKQAIDALAEGGILLLENTRFHKGEEKNDADFAKFYNGVIEKVGAIPGVQDAGLINTLPLFKGPTSGFRVEGRPVTTPDKWPSVNYRVVSPNYFRAMGIPVLQGRT